MRKMPAQKPGESNQIIGTPPEFVIAACRIIGIASFTRDVACLPENAIPGVSSIFTPAEDGLSQSWDLPPGGWNWLNPEFGSIGVWAEKAYRTWDEENTPTAMLVPASVGAEWWVNWVERKAQVVPLRGRLPFVGYALGYPKDCALVLYGREPGYVDAVKWFELLTQEEKQMARERVKKERIKKAAATVVDIRQGRPKSGKRGIPPEDPTPEAQGTAPAEAPAAPPAPEAGMVRTFTPNAPQAVVVGQGTELRLPPVVLPDPATAVAVLGEVAKLTDQAKRQMARVEELKASHKMAKDRLDALNEQITDLVFRATHKTDLPLFDGPREEQAVAAMVAADAAAVQAQPAAEDPSVEAVEEAPAIPEEVSTDPIEETPVVDAAPEPAPADAGPESVTGEVF